MNIEGKGEKFDHASVFFREMRYKNIKQYFEQFLFSLMKNMNLNQTTHWITSL